ncbi:MAG: D-alanine--D-alanine ligase [Pirellulaceae bacterium]|nr:D-alanine--D-alanine ligase [Planctomycetales bacterium]
MRIGFTYDLRNEYLAAGYSEEETAEFDRPDTIDAIEDALTSIGHTVQRIGNARQLVQQLASWPDGSQPWDLVFNICEGLHGPGREAQVPAILEAYDIAYTFADPLVMSLCLQKALTKTIVEQAGVPTPRFCVIHDQDELDTIRDADWEFPAFAKPVAEGTGKGVTPQSRVNSVCELADQCEQLLKRFSQPVLIEQFLPGREFTVGVLGTGKQATVLGTLEIVLRDQAEPDVYSYENKERCESLVEYRLVKPDRDAEVAAAERFALLAWQTLGCRDGGRIDLRSNTLGQPQFLEANPLAGLHPSHSDLPMLATALGWSYRELIAKIVASAAERCVSHARRYTL